MFRFDGEVFLLGTAIPAPLKSNKNCDDLRLVLAGRPRGGGRIVANRGSYSEKRGKRKAFGRRMRCIGFRAIADIRFRGHTQVVRKRKWHSSWIWIGAFALAVVAVGVIATQSPEAGSQSKNFPIAGVLYSWPAGTTIIPPPPPGIYGKGYVRYFPRQSGFRLIYDGNKQEPENEAGLPDLQLIANRFSKREDLSFHETAVGTVVCHRKLAQTGYLFPCGLSFVHRGARWQLQFGFNEVPNTEKFHRDAVTTLETFRKRGVHKV